MSALTSTRKPSQPCCPPGCGCHDQGCTLECLSHPRFYCGQRLDDQDLTALVDWVKDKSSLARYRHGWGIVCGLEVRVAEGGSVAISPGYAMDCCGRDIVVCQGTKFDLTACWQRPPSVCTHPPAHAPQLPAPPNVVLNGLTFEGAEVQVFDVLLRYAERQSDARAGVARGGCGSSSTANCEYTRVEESYEIDCHAVQGDDDPNQRAFTAWEAGYLAARDKKLNELAALAGEQDAKKRLQFTIGHVQKNPLTTFGYVLDWLRKIQTEANQPNATLSADWDGNVLYWIMQDWRNDRFKAACADCKPWSDIPLARVWLRRPVGQTLFTTLYVEAHPPFRRPLAQTAWPTVTGGVNLAPYLGAETAAALRSLRQIGINVEVTEFVPANLSGVLRREEFIGGLSTGGPVTLHKFDDASGRSRVVCFTFDAAARQQKIDSLKPNDPLLDLKKITGIGRQEAADLKRARIKNLRDLAGASAAAVTAAIGTQPPADQLIASAKQAVDDLGRTL